MSSKFRRNYGETLDYDSLSIYVTTVDGDIGSLQSLHTLLFDKH